MTRSETTEVQNLHISETPLGTAFDSLSIFSGATEAQRMLQTLWAGHTYIYRAFPATPRLAFMADEPNSGKTVNMQVTLAMSHKSKCFGYSSQAALYAWLDEHPDTTYGLDEIDKAFGSTGRSGGRPIAASVVNDGYTTKGSVMVMRGSKAVDIPVFAPVATAGIGRLPADTLTRAVPIHLQRVRPEEVYVPELHDDGLGAIGGDIGDWLSTRDAREFMASEPKMLTLEGGGKNNDPRFQMIMAPLSAIARYAGCGDQFVEAVREITTGIVERPPTPLHELMLWDLREAWPADLKIMTGSEAIERLRNHESGRWSYMAQNRLAETTVAGYMRQNGIESKTSNGTRGYAYGDVFAGFERTE